MDLHVAETILEQLGGGLFRLMTGARFFVGDQTSLTFSLPDPGKDGATIVKISLTAADDYTLETFVVRGGERRLCSKRHEVYAEDLREVFRDVTGYAARL